MAESEQEKTGLGVDSSGGPVVDPTRNVLDLVSAAIKRQDDLREAESRHIREMVKVRSEYDTELREAESARIDAIRRVDVEAVQRAAEVQANQQTVLANQVAAAAEAMRTQVAAAATAAATALGAALEPIIKDIADLRRAQYEAQGQKTQVVETQAHGASTNMWVGLAVAGFVAMLVVVSTAVVILAAVK
jgi:hypothetical protein